jgi:hypothetical protein
MLASETEMFPVEKYYTHIERIRAAIGVNGPVADFFGHSLTFRHVAAVNRFFAWAASNGSLQAIMLSRIAC